MSVVIICKQCGVEFTSSPSNNRKFCSRNCANLGRYKIPWNKGLTVSTDLRIAEYGQKLKGRHVTQLTRSKISNSNHGHIPWNKGKVGVQIGYWTGKQRSPEIKQMLYALRFDHTHSAKTKQKMRLSAIQRIERTIGQLTPNYNPIACQYFNQLAEQTGTHIQHAENGGEFHIKELGYWVDGYDAENNIVYEFDEKHHFQNEKLKSNDIQRQIEIEQHLNCKFIRINDKN